MSAMFTLAAALFVYLIIKHLLAENKNNRKWACLGAFIFGASALVFAQATIVETYAVVTFFSIAAYYFVLKKRWAWASSMIGMGLITHHLILLTWVVLILPIKEGSQLFKSLLVFRRMHVLNVENFPFDGR